MQHSIATFEYLYISVSWKNLRYFLFSYKKYILLSCFAIRKTIFILYSRILLFMFFSSLFCFNWLYIYIRSPEKFLSIYKEIMDAQHFPFYIILSNYVWSILFYQNKNHNVRQIRFHVCIKMHRRKRRVCKRKTLSGQPNIYIFSIITML